MQGMLTEGTSASGEVNRSENLQKFSAFKGKKVVLILAEESKCFQDGIAKISGFFRELSESQCITLDEVEYYSRPGRNMMGSREICIRLDDIKDVESDQ